MTAFGDPQNAPNQRPPKRGRSIGFYLFVGLGILIILGLGSCIWMFVGLFEKAAERQAATKVFIETVFRDGGLPGPKDPIYDAYAGATAEGVDAVAGWVKDFGPPTTIGETQCSVTTSANSEKSKNGTFAFCTTPMMYQNTAGHIEMTWVMVEDEWKIRRYFTTYDEADGTLEPKTSKAAD